MKTMFIFMLMVTTSAFAGDNMVFRKGVNFNHLKHQEENVGICLVCHVSQVGKIADFGKAWAHKNCVGCHDLYNKGPTGCSGCHHLV